ncbi:hypothetical protein B0H13DRAFT_2306027 [Mycena leptocephala]|nr:hypothetical protein B0H13DRAFT_2306027 [Mycena leptocephala]
MYIDQCRETRLQRSAPFCQHHLVGRQACGLHKKQNPSAATAAAAAADATAAVNEIVRLKAQIEEMAAANKAFQDGAAGQEDIRLEKPKGEAGDRKKSFVLQTAMGLYDDNETFNAILCSVHANVVRANLDVKQDYCKQDPAKLSAIFKPVMLRLIVQCHGLIDTAHPDTQGLYLTEKCFPLNWSTAEMVKQYLCNKCSPCLGSNKHRKTNAATTTRHVDDDDGGDEEEEKEEEGNKSDEGNGGAEDDDTDVAP